MRSLLLVVVALFSVSLQAAEATRPNVLWITCEDLSPIIGPYGDTFATTPNLNAFATKSLRYRMCWSNAPVCAPARTTLITGMYATSLGAEHMRSEVPLPADWKLYPQVLREAGYYCTNNTKTDYNVVPNGEVWDDTSKNAHWKNRPKDKPFFAIFNTTVTHESQVHNRRKLKHDPAKVRVPAYQPDLPEIRADWAQYYDNVTEMDEFVGARLKELAEAGLAEDTIVWFYSDHGCGLPRSKRVPFNSGLQVPFLLHIPEKFKHLRPADYAPGGETPRLVSFVDFGPTLLSLCGVNPPEHMQGKPFLGPFTTEARAFLFGFRGRMDERIDVVRSVTDGRYVYVRNFMPEKPQGGYLAYMYKQAGVQAWRKAYEKGGLPPEQAAFFEPKPAEALFDLQSDRDEVRNLVETTEGRRIADGLKKALEEHMLRTGDLGVLPEAEMLRMADGGAPAEIHSRKDALLGDALRTAMMASGRGATSKQELIEQSQSPSAASRYWAIRGLQLQGASTVREQRGLLTRFLRDDSPSVRIAAAEAMASTGDAQDRETAMRTLVEMSHPKKYGVGAAILALNSLDAIGPVSRDVVEQVKSTSELPPKTPQRMREYVPRLLERLGERAK